jgi:hypothetical protein
MSVTEIILNRTIGQKMLLAKDLLIMVTIKIMISSWKVFVEVVFHPRIGFNCIFLNMISTI